MKGIKQYTAKHPAIKVIAFLLADLIAAGGALCVFAYFHHVRPQVLDPVVIESTGGEDTGDAAAAEETTQSDDLLAGGYSEMFTDSGAQWNTDSYASGSVSISVKTYVLNEGDADEIITYYVEDIYIKDITSLKTALAEDTFGHSIVEHPLIMALQNDAICAINGDYYGSHTSHGVVIRNGEVYRLNPNQDVCIIYTDGTMKLYTADEFFADTDAIIENAWQGWSFGPSLVIDGKAVTAFDSDIGGKNPRTAIGYYEPGHYCFVTIDGRQDGYSNGMTFEEMAKLFTEMGCTMAYNLDGGKSAMMTFDDKIVNVPYHDVRESSDIVYICEP